MLDDSGGFEDDVIGIGGRNEGANTLSVASY
jgi:hypothetical protein